MLQSLEGHKYSTLSLGELTNGGAQLNGSTHKVVSVDGAPGCPGQSWSELLDLGSLFALAMFHSPQREHISMKRIFLV